MTENTNAARTTFLPAYVVMGGHLAWLLAASLRADVLLTLVSLAIAALSPTRGGAIAAIVVVAFMAVGNVLTLTAIGFGHEKVMLVIAHLAIRLLAIGALIWGITRLPREPT